METQVARWIEGNSLVRVKFVKGIHDHVVGERGVMPYAKAKELIERGIVRATETGRDGGPVKFHVTPPIDGHIHVVE